MNDASAGLTLSHAAVEGLVASAFERARDGRGMMATRGDLGVDLQLVPSTSEFVLNIRLLVWDIDASGASSIRDIKEQGLYVPPDADDARIGAFYEGVGRSLQLRIDGGEDLDLVMPHDFLPEGAFADPSRTSPQAFATFAFERSKEKPVAPGSIDVNDVSVTTPIAINEELERAIADDFDRIETQLVYADWLTERGDPRGELIACSQPDATAVQRRRAAQILAENRAYFSANLEHAALERYIETGWRLGWLTSARLSVDWDLASASPDFVAKALRALMTIPSAKFLRSLTLGCFDFDGDHDYDALLPILREAGVRPSMRSLFLGDLVGEEREISWVSAGHLATLDGLYPNLTSLQVRAGGMTLAGGLSYPKLEALVIVSGGLARENVQAIANAVFPELRHLEIWFGSASYGGNATVADIAPILAGANFPKLETLALRNSEFTDAICEALVASAIGQRIQKLDLSKGTMSAAGALALAAGTFPKLTSLDVSENHLEDAAAFASFVGRGVEVTCEEQKAGSGEDRYVSLSE